MDELFVSRAFDEAITLGHGWVGTEHFLLALLAAPSAARDVLAEVGVTHGRVVELMRSARGTDLFGEASRLDAERGLSGPTPAGSQVMGRAEAFALAQAAGGPTPEHWLLAILLAGEGMLPAILGELGTTRTAVLDGLRRTGSYVAGLDVLSDTPPWRGRRQIEVSRGELSAVLDALLATPPAGSTWRWGFNGTRENPDEFRITAEEGIDLDGIVGQARRQASS